MYGVSIKQNLLGMAELLGTRQPDSFNSYKHLVHLNWEYSNNSNSESLLLIIMLPSWQNLYRYLKQYIIGIVVNSLISGKKNLNQISPKYQCYTHFHNCIFLTCEQLLRMRTLRSACMCQTTNAFIVSTLSFK